MFPIWKRTLAPRSLLDNDIDVEGQIERYKPLQQSYTYELLCWDFDKMYADLIGLFGKLWPEVAHLIVKIAEEDSRCMDAEKFYQENKYLVQEGKEFLLGFFLLPLMEETKNVKAKWRPTKNEVVDGFILHLQEEDPYPCALSVQKSVVAGSLAPMRATTWHPQDFFNPPPNYPVRFPCLKNMIGREEIDERGFRSLYANQKVNDQFINGMAVIMARRALERGHRFTIMPSFYSSALIVVGKPSIGLSNWVVRNRVDRSDFLFLPLNDVVAEHWFGWAIDFKAKKLIFLDSLGGKPNPVWIARLCSSMKSVKFTNTEVQWKEWTSITTSHDLPSQHPTAGNESRDNCGVHLFVWMILICTGYDYEYCEEEMNGVRRMIATILMSKEFPKEAMSNRPDRRLDFLDTRQFNRCWLEMKHAESQKDVEFMNALSLLSNFLS
ncbi:hypothetical protein QAD02_000708 [Eretmocerus hayati]|uniref:Uncharacterized protein n=1 Tax=Eretmocerus hayati TaxID=131215 RepID=A0ACC2NEE6_9HYME|nr:hypothetical protein QAD02_000708 [Eretmocerus hayati]